MKTLLVENTFGHGAIKTNPIRRKIRKFYRAKLGKGLPFDWNKGFDVRDIIGTISIKNQGTNDSCSGQAGSYFLEIQRRLQKINEGSISAKSIYAPIFYPGGGTTIARLEKQISQAGGNLESAVPSSDASGQPLPEYMMEDTSWITSYSLQDALGRAGYIPFDVPLDMDDISANIRDYGAVIIEIEGQNGHTPGWLSSTPQPPVPNNGNEIFYHFLCLCGAKLINGQKTLIALESMGNEVGENGIQYFTQNYFDAKGILDCMTFIYGTHIQPISGNVSPLEKLWQWIQKNILLTKSNSPGLSVVQ